MQVETKNAIDEALSCGVLTPADKIDFGTFVCLSIEYPDGKQHFQGEFEKIPKDWQAVLKGMRKGQRHHQVEILSVFDLWD